VEPSPKKEYVKYWVTREKERDSSLPIVCRHESFTAADRPGPSSGCKPYEDYSVDDNDDKDNCGAVSTVSN
jgi:hypothetical protein